MKNLFRALALYVLVAGIFSCEKDEGELPHLVFKTGGSYTSADATLAGGTAITIGIEAAKSEEKDPLIKFDISESINSGPKSSVYNVDLTEAQGDEYDYDFNTTLDTISGQTVKYVFTITNKDGIINQIGLTLTIQ